ncbi:hypothetical protein TWF225_003599 [Orbilia oligospora]|nr:hypothetical protein TWF225_003599 [Orbilia oligospora]KAF3262003.1 hypothetical protein TWF128_002698 [Orbilia oligospora]KAF3266709.1 hypothetical protein TWF217_001489 [Orbilia oligospora]
MIQPFKLWWIVAQRAIYTKENDTLFSYMCFAPSLFFRFDYVVRYTLRTSGSVVKTYLAAVNYGTVLLNFGERDVGLIAAKHSDLNPPAVARHGILLDEILKRKSSD